MVILQASNQSITKDAKFSYTTQNYVSGVSAIVIKNSDIVEQTLSSTDGVYALFGEFGSQQSEIILLSSVNTTTHTLNLATNTVYSHPQDTKITIVRYNQVLFYQTAASTFSSTENYLGAVSIQAYKTHTIYQDTVNTTGYGWFRFSNSVNLQYTTNSNAIPYGGFESGSVKEIFNSFFSLLNNAEMKLISHQDAFAFLNEGYNRALNELNLVNNQYGVEAEDTITTVSGTAEYDLKSNFGELVSISNSDGTNLDFIKLSDINKNNVDNTYSTTTVKYSIRNTKIIFSPTPTTSGDVFDMYYKKKITTLTSYFQNIELPNNNFYPMVDFMMYRASQKLNRPNPINYFKSFLEGINLMKITSFKQDSSLDSWGVADSVSV
jgi:hypothetical protein